MAFMSPKMKSISILFCFIFLPFLINFIHFSLYTPEMFAKPSSMPQRLSIHITMSSETVQKLKNNNTQLHGFKAVKAFGQGFPLIWFTTDSYLVRTTVDWIEDYQAYITTQLDLQPGDIIAPCPVQAKVSPIMSNLSDKNIIACASQVVNLGEQMIVDRYGNTSVMLGNNKDSISIVNQAQMQWSAGLSQAVVSDLEYSPLCAFSLYGGYSLVITPQQKVLLMFSSQVEKAGTIVTRSFGPSILVNLTGVQSRDLTYDIYQGWGPTDQTWAEIIPVNSDLQPLLIEQ